LTEKTEILQKPEEKDSKSVSKKAKAGKLVAPFDPFGISPEFYIRGKS
jgi:hypothetical protein